MNLPGYEQAVLLNTSQRTVVYRALSLHSHTSVILKLLPPEHALPQAVARMRYEFELAGSLEHPCLAKPVAFIETLGWVGVAFEDIHGTSLRALSQAKPLSLHACLDIARQVAMALVALHEHHIVHRDVTPKNVVFNPETGRAQLIDLGIASRTSRDRAAMAPAALFEGTLPFVAPEQTGRLQRSVDGRSDLYALGCTLYNMLTGRLPFEQQDTLALIHAILARQPTPPHSLIPAVPKLLSDLVMVLLAKDPEQRYQSAAGVLADVQTAQQLLQQTGAVAAFPLRRADADETFRLPEKLYGRSDALAKLTEVLQSVMQTGDNAVALIDGRSGQGKSALVQALQPAIHAGQALYGAGKFNQLQRSIPYSALNEALSLFLRQMLAQCPPATVNDLRHRLSGALGRAGGALTSMLPAFTLLIGEQPAPHPLGPKASEDRLLMLLQEVMRVLAVAQHPVVLFIDDAQWADAQSLAALRLWGLPGRAPYTLLLLAYRTEDVDHNHPLRAVVEHWQQNAAQLAEIHVEPLQRQAVELLIADTLACSVADAAPLAALVTEKTAGNAFFIGEFLHHLHDCECFHYVRAERRWRWEMGTIVATNVTNNVVELTLQRMRELPEASQKALAFASAAGNVVELHPLALAMQIPAPQLAEDLWSAVSAGIVQPLDDAYQYVVADSSQIETRAVRYKFVHDRVQQAAALLVSEAERQSMRYALAMLLMRSLADDARDAQILAIAAHLHAAAACITVADAPQVREVLLLAGRRAKAANACATARDYLLVAEKLMPADPWETCYAAYLALQMDLAECEDFTSNTEAARLRIDGVLAHCREPWERLQVHTRYASLLAAQNQLKLALDSGMAALRSVGVPLPRHPSVLQVLLEVLRVRRVQGKRTAAQLYAQPELQDRHQESCLHLLAIIAPIAFVTEPNLFVVLSLRNVAISMRFGNSPSSAVPYASFGIVLASALNRPQEAYEFGQLGMRLMERYGAAASPAAVLMAVSGLLTHFHHPLSLAVERAEQSYRMGVETGEMDPAFRSACVVISFQLVMGRPLESISVRADDFAKTLQERGELIAREVLLAYRQTVRALVGLTQTAVSLTDGEYDETHHLDTMQAMQARAPLADYYSLKMQLCVWQSAWEEAEKYGMAGHDVAAELRGMPMQQQFYFFYALAISQRMCADARHNTLARRLRLRRLRGKLQWWAEAGPPNFAGDLQLIDAQCARVAGRPGQAAPLYEKALETYERAAFINKIALAYECYGRMCLQTAQPYSAEDHMRSARAAYAAWGAKRKTAQLEGEFPYLRKASTRLAHTASHTTTRADTETTGSSAADTDMAAVLTALDLLAAETQVERLQQRLLHNLLLYVGADRAVLIQKRHGAWAAVGQAHQAAEAATSAFPTALLRYVEQTREVLLFDDVARHVEHAGETYFQEHPVKSALCLPLLHHGELKGFLYAENSLIAYAFSAERVTTCRVLAIQAVIALENATLHSELEEKIAARTQELRNVQDRLVRVERDATEQQMAGGFAHEMRNTLSAARFAIDAVMGGGDAPRVDEQIVRMTHAIADLNGPDAVAEKQRLQQTIDEMAVSLQDVMQLTQDSVVRALDVTAIILDYAQLGFDRRGTTAVDVRTVVQKAMESARPTLLADVDLQAGLRDTHVFYGSENHFASIVTHLLNNASESFADYSAPRPRVIRVETEVADQRLILRITDTAAGMPPEVQRRLFEPFFSTKPSTGMGLGLAMVRKLAQLYEGRVEIHSALGEGTRVEIYYPLG